MSRNGRLALVVFILSCASLLRGSDDPQIGTEVAIPAHLQDGEEYQRSIRQLVDFGRKLFMARWTIQEGAGRPKTKGTGAPLTDEQSPLVFPRNFNRISGPDTNSCAGCHNSPDVGGGGDIVANVFVLGQRFDFVTFDGTDTTPTRGTLDERGSGHIADGRQLS